MRSSLRSPCDENHPIWTIDHRLQQGRLHRVFRGVYLVGHPVPPPLARELAALLACGPDAVLSHRTAAVLWRILPPVPGPIHVTLPKRRLRSRPGLRAHLRPLEASEIRGRHGLRLTSPARTIRDPTPSWIGRRSSERSTRHRCSSSPPPASGASRRRAPLAPRPNAAFSP